MNPVLIAQLLATFGPAAVQLIDTLIQKIHTSGTVTPEEWASLRTQALQTAKDRMLLQLQAAGIDPTSPQGQLMLSGL